MNDTIYEFEVAFAFSVIKLIQIKTIDEEEAKQKLIEETDRIIASKEIKIEDCTRPLKTVLTVAVKDSGGYRNPSQLFTSTINKHLTTGTKNGLHS